MLWLFSRLSWHIWRVKKRREEWKYKNYIELFDAYKSGELTEPLMMDNDDSFVYVDDVCVFRGGGEMDTIDILEAIGIPVEHV